MINRFKALSGLALLALGGAGGLALFTTSPAETRPRTQPALAGEPVLVELFTSQGCSSCPPADAALERLAKEPGIVAISRPVTYWDRLGWKDTLAREANTQLQRAYAARGGIGGGVYTPQAVVQGGDSVVGSREAAVRELVARAERPARIAVHAVAGGGRQITVEGSAGGSASLDLIALRSSVEVGIGRGENGGRRIRYTNVVVDEQPLGKWAGKRATYSVPPAAIKVEGADRYALVLRQGRAGPVLAARYL